MKKKNVIGHMAVPKDRNHKWYRRFGVIPRLICLLLAVLLWLLVVNANEYLSQKGEPSVPGGAQTESISK